MRAHSAPRRSVRSTTRSQPSGPCSGRPCCAVSGHRQPSQLLSKDVDLADSPPEPRRQATAALTALTWRGSPPGSPPAVRDRRSRLAAGRQGCWRSDVHHEIRHASARERRSCTRSLCRRHGDGRVGRVARLRERGRLRAPHVERRLPPVPDGPRERARRAHHDAADHGRRRPAAALRPGAPGRGDGGPRPHQQGPGLLRRGHRLPARRVRDVRRRLSPPRQDRRREARACCSRPRPASRSRTRAARSR